MIPIKINVKPKDNRPWHSAITFELDGNGGRVDWDNGYGDERDMRFNRGSNIQISYGYEGLERGPFSWSRNRWNLNSEVIVYYAPVNTQPVSGNWDNQRTFTHDDQWTEPATHWGGGGERTFNDISEELINRDVKIEFSFWGDYGRMVRQREWWMPWFWWPLPLVYEPEVTIGEGTMVFTIFLRGTLSVETTDAFNFQSKEVPPMKIESWSG